MLENETGDWNMSVELDCVCEQLFEGLAPELLDGNECAIAQQPEHNVRVVLINPNESTKKAALDINEIILITDASKEFEE